MSARLLVTDDNPLNVKLLSAKLAREYYTVITAENGLETLEKAVSEKPDLILLDVMMPGLDGFETCRQIKANPATQGIPVVMVTALSDVQDRVRGLDAGADDFLTKPINDIALMARVRSCLRLKSLMDEWRMREGNSAMMSDIDDDSLRSGQIILLDDQPHEQSIIKKHILHAGMVCHAITTSAEIEPLLARERIHTIMINLNLIGEEGLRVCANLKANESTRHVPVIVYADESELGKIAKALDIGANDYIFKPVDPHELQARLRTQIRHKRTYDRLRLSYEKNMAMAVTDPLTGAYNRHYLEKNAPRLFNRSRATKRPISIVMLDIDHFKKINDSYGHHAGDQVLQELVRRLNNGLRFFDMVVRMGGEEFALVMPEAPYSAAMSAAERLRASICNVPFDIRDPQIEIPVTISVGVAGADEGEESAEILFRKADAALYKAKEAGRNRVIGEKET
ncbi:MAG: PleD family two-component system response regulator [Alphaproteobacteria bacterium]|nr:PleD family two-component system response regulator [Alphaproteobacteria bacterium]